MIYDMGILSFVIPIFTITYVNITLFILTSCIFFFSAFLFLTHSKNKVQVFEQEVNDVHLLNESNKGCLVTGLQDSCSESEVIDQFEEEEEDSDFERWQFSGETCRRTECSDGSISDEESLIEIALPGGHYVGYNDYKHEVEESKFYCRKGSPESVLWWPEMNEEENMIEIDLSMGSIKCSRFGIKA